MDSTKVYVDVNVRFSKEGKLTPTSIIWEDGTEYEIQSVKDVCRAASLKAGGAGTRYTCVISGRESHLFYEENNQWFVERK